MCSLIDSNLLSVHVNSVYSVPEAWQVQMAQQFNYTVSLPVPLSKEVTIFFCWTTRDYLESGMAYLGRRA